MIFSTGGPYGVFHRKRVGLHLNGPYSYRLSPSFSLQMPGRTSEDCTTDRWWLCHRQGRCRQTTARTRSTPSSKPTKYFGRENKSVNFNLFFFLSFFLLFFLDSICWRPFMIRYLNERRLNGNEAQTQSHPVTLPQTLPQPIATPTSTSSKRSAPAGPTSHDGQAKRPRGRPKGSKNRSKDGGNDTAAAWLWGGKRAVVIFTEK